MKKSELQVHDAPRFPDSRDIRDNPEKVISDLNMIIKQLWQRQTQDNIKINLLEEKVEQIGGLRPPLRYPV